MILFSLFYEFFKTGLFAIGGGLATIPFLSEMSEKTGWFTLEELTNMIAISESTPGPTGINMASFVGYTCAGLPGAFIATFGEVLPSILIISVLSGFIQAFKNNPYVEDAMVALRACSLGLILYAFTGVVTSSLILIGNYDGNLLSVFDPGLIFIFVVTLFCNLKIKSHPVIWIALSALLGILLF